MPVNSDKPHLWKADVIRSVDFYNDWFLRFAPNAYRETRVLTTRQVELALSWTSNLTRVAPDVLSEHPELLPMLRMATAPPIARDRLIGLTGVSPNLVRSMELRRRMPPRMPAVAVREDLERIGALFERLADQDLFPWLQSGAVPGAGEVHRSASVVADRLCGATADPIIRNAQEQRQFAMIQEWLEARGYTRVPSGQIATPNLMRPGTFSFRLDAPVVLEDGSKRVKVPIDVAIMSRNAPGGGLPLLVEAKSAGDYTNTNKRRKEEAVKVAQLRRTYGPDVCFVLFLCGYFDTGYLGYEAAEGIDWVWEHRMDDLAGFGL